MQNKGHGSIEIPTSIIIIFLIILFCVFPLPAGYILVGILHPWGYCLKFNGLVVAIFIAIGIVLVLFIGLKLKALHWKYIGSKRRNSK